MQQTPKFRILKQHMLIFSQFCESGIWAWLSWILCSGSFTGWEQVVSWGWLTMVQVGKVCFQTRLCDCWLASVPPRQMDWGSQSLVRRPAPSGQAWETVLCNLITDVTPHHFCCVGPYWRGWDHTRVWTPGVDHWGHVRGCLPQR